jgi:hypothetical protein
MQDNVTGVLSSAGEDGPGENYIGAKDSRDTLTNLDSVDDVLERVDRVDELLDWARHAATGFGVAVFVEGGV